MNTLKRIGICLLALLVVFGGWYVSDPQMALLQGADLHNVKALANPPLYRMVVYMTYVMAVVVPWICTTPIGRTNEKQGIVQGADPEHPQKSESARYPANDRT